MLLTHDVMIEKSDDVLVKELQYVINNPAMLHTKNDWITFHKRAGFLKSEYYTGKMTLLSNSGMMIDEGFFRMFKIIKNGLTDTNRKQFLDMMKFFRKNKSKMNFIAICSTK